MINGDYIKLDNEEILRQKFEQQINEITNRQLTVENVDTYAEQALGDTINVVETVIAEYAKLDHNTYATKREFEQKAFEKFGLRNIEEVLDHIANVHDQLNEIDQFIKQSSTADQVFVPPNAITNSVGSGSGEFQTPLILPKLKSLLFCLGRYFNLEVNDASSVQVVRGSVDAKMFRQQPYYEVIINDLNRRVMTCDESGNATFIFDDEKLPAEIKDQLKNCTKQELNNLMARCPGCGTKLIYGKNYITNLVNALESEVDQPEQLDKAVDVKFLSIEKATTPRAPEGYLNVRQIVKALGVSAKTVNKNIKDLGLQPERYKNTQGLIYDYYSPAQIQQIKTYLADFINTEHAPAGYLLTYKIAQRLKLGFAFIETSSMSLVYNLRLIKITWAMFIITYRLNAQNPKYQDRLVDL